VRAAVRKRLLASDVQGALARCLDTVGGFGVAAGPAPHGRPPVVLLELEGLGSEIRIAEVRVVEWSGIGPDAASCARGVLRGQGVRAQGIARGERMQMNHRLDPRSEVVAAGPSGRASAPVGK
jgi:hypothetical protein